MKKLLIPLLTLVLVLALAACSKSEIPSAESIDTTETIATPEAEQLSEAPAVADDTISETPPADALTVHTHEFTSEVTAPTCTQEGFTTYTCACGENYVGDPVQALDHTFGQWNATKQPTESATGTAERSCSSCGEVEAKTLGKLDANHTHSYTSHVTQTATCRTEGKTVFTCTCGDSYTERTPMADHDYSTKVYEPNCDTYGCTRYWCKTCGKSYFGDYVAAYGHYGDYAIIKDATCTETGINSYSCPCGWYYEFLILAKGHPYEVTHEEKTTCVTAGYKIYTCRDCGDEYTYQLDDSPSPYGHEYEDILVKPATCTERSVIETTCVYCKHVSFVSGTPYLGHQLVYGAEHCDKEQACQRCGELVHVGHNYSSFGCRNCGKTWCDIHGHLWRGNMTCDWGDCGEVDQVAQAKAEAIVAEILAKYSTEYDIVKAIHDYIVNNTEYDYDNYLNDTILATSYGPRGVLLYGVAVCSGYAEAFKVLCDLAGIECVEVGGWAVRSGEGHAWNQVRIDGIWYNIDVCWDDPVSSRPILRYDYFLISNEEFYTTHGTNRTIYDCAVSHPGSHT